MVAALDLTTVVVGATVVDIMLVERVVVAAVTGGVLVVVVDVGVVVDVFALVLALSDDATESFEDGPDFSADEFFVVAIPGEIADSLIVALGCAISFDSLVVVGFGVVGLESLVDAMVGPDAVNSLLDTAGAASESLAGEIVADVDSLLLVFVCVIDDDSFEDSSFALCDALVDSLVGNTRAYGVGVESLDPILVGDPEAESLIGATEGVVALDSLQLGDIIGAVVGVESLVGATVVGVDARDSLFGTIVVLVVKLGVCVSTIAAVDTAIAFAEL